MRGSGVAGTGRTRPSGSAQTTGSGKTHGSSITSQRPSGRTPPHGPMTMCLGQEPFGGGLGCIGSGFHDCVGPAQPGMVTPSWWTGTPSSAVASTLRSVIRSGSMVSGLPSRTTKSARWPTASDPISVSRRMA